MKKIILLLVAGLLLIPVSANAIEIVRQKNAATYITVPLIDSDGAPVTSATTPDSEMDAWSDGSAPDGFADMTNEATEIGSTGIYYLSITQTEMNNDYIYIQIKSADIVTQHVLIRTTVADPLLYAATDDGGVINVTGGAVDTVTTTTTATTATNVTTVNGLASGVITATSIASNAITSAKIATDAIGAAQIAANAIGASEIATDAIGAAEIAADAIGASEIAANAITSSEFAQSAADLVWGTTTRLLTAGTNIALAKGTGVTGFNDLATSDIDARLAAIGLDHLLAASVTGTDVTDNSIIAKLVSKSATADWDDFVNTTESLQAIRDNGDSAWITATGFSTHSAADVWTSGTRELTALDEDNTTIDLNASAVGSVAGNVDGSVASVTGAVGSVTGAVGSVTGAVGSVTGNVGGTINGLTATALADLFDTDSGTTYSSAVAGSVVKEIADNSGGGTPPTAAAIADAVWDEATADHTTAGTTGKKLGDLPTSGTTDWTANEKTELKAVLGITDTGTPDNTPASGALYEIQGATFSTATDSLEALRNRGDTAWITAAGFSTHSAADVWAVATRVLTAGTNLNDITAADVWAAGTRTLTALDEDSTTIDLNATTIGTVTTVTNGVTVTTNNDKSGYSLSAAGVDAIWDEVQSGHATAGSFGIYLNEAISGIDDNPWDNGTRTLTAGTKDTEIDAIKAKTDNLPTDPADASDIAASFAGLNDPSAATIADAVWDETSADHTSAGTTGEKLDDIPLTGTADFTAGERTLIKSALGISDGDVDTGADMDGLLLEIKKSRGR